MHKLGAMAAFVVVGCSSGTSTEPPSSAGEPSTSVEDLSAHHRHPRVAQRVTRTDLVSDEAGAATLDANLVNAWGISFNPNGFAWVSDNGTGKATVYDARGALHLTVDLPAAAGSDSSAPTGQVFNADPSSFRGDRFLFASEDGGISGWQPSGATLRIDSSASGAVYKGIAIAEHRGALRLYAANFNAGTVDVFDASYAPIATRGFVDRDLPSGYAPFNVFADGDVILVAYALQDDAKHDDVKGAGHGFLDAFDTDGDRRARLVSGGALDSPWGMAMVGRFGHLHHRLLVGNFGDGHINVYEVERSWRGVHVEHEGVLGDASGAPLVIDGLWGLVVPPEAGGFHATQLVLSAGPAGESHGRFGTLDAL
jgi:uncharacterized protein (TIGR03118 family)